MIKKYCIDCGKEIFNWKALRCHKCANWIITRSLIGKKHTEEHKRKLKASWNYAKHITTQWRKKQSEIHKGIPVIPKGSKWSEKQRENIMKGRKPWTIERRKKYSEMHSGNKNYSWKDGKTIQNGYIDILVSPRKYKREHRLVMEKHLGRKLKSIEHVHHIDGNKKNNDINNLMLFPNAKAHAKYHISISGTAHNFSP